MVARVCSAAAAREKGPARPSCARLPSVTCRASTIHLPRRPQDLENCTQLLTIAPRAASLRTTGDDASRFASHTGRWHSAQKEERRAAGFRPALLHVLPSDKNAESLLPLSLSLWHKLLVCSSTPPIPHPRRLERRQASFSSYRLYRGSIFSWRLRLDNLVGSPAR